MSILSDNNRIDSILIWGHGMKYFQEILNDIRENKNFNIIKIKKHKPKNMKSFVKEMYSFDYAPFWHLKAKTKYLMKTSSEVCFIFIENNYPDEDYLGEGSFRHKESLTLKKFKEILRDKYNPYENGKRTHNHVIHATDSQDQTDHMLHYLGYAEGVKLFDKPTKIVAMPYYLKGYNKFDFITLKTDDIFCNIIDGESWNKFTSNSVKIKQSPQYLGLTQDMKIYENYIDKYLGGPLQENYSLDRYARLSDCFEYLKTPYETSFVIVEKVEDKFIILDGLHRACNHISQGHKEIKVCQISR